MAAPVFGFSVGDFIAGIHLAIDVIKACKDTGGASSQYESVLVEFEAYLTILHKIQDPDVWTQTEINRLASSCEPPVKQFVTKIEKYRNSLAKSAVPYDSVHHTARYLRTFPRKAQWAIVAKKTVDELRLGIEPHLSAIGLLIELENTKVLANIAFAHQTSTALIQASAEATKQQMERIERNQTALIDSIVKDGLSNLHFVVDTIRRSTNHGRADAVDLHRQSNIQLSRIGSKLSSLANLDDRIARDSSQAIKDTAAVEAITRFREASDDSGEPEQRDIYLIRIFDSLAAILRKWIIQTLFLLPYWRAFVILVRSIPAVPTGLLSDNITFVDVLGRQMSLSYADFRYWPVFKARLRVAFRGVPGERKVLEQEYRVLTHDHRIIDPPYWTDLVLPGSKLRMSVVLCDTIEDRVCPQPACRARVTQCQAVRDGGVMVICPKCETTSYSRNVSILMYFDPLKRSQPTFASHCEWIQERFEALKKRHRVAKVSEAPGENEIRFFKYIHVSSTLIWTKERIFKDIPTDILTTSALLRGYERTNLWNEYESIRQILIEEVIRSGSGLNLQQIHLLKASDCVPEYVITAWLASLDADRQVSLHEKIEKG